MADKKPIELNSIERMLNEAVSAYHRNRPFVMDRKKKEQELKTAS
jgi:hypothetical protein